MRKIKQLSNKKKIVFIFFLFLISYTVSLIVWEVIKDIYGYTLFKIAAHSITYVHDVSLTSLDRAGNNLEAVFQLKPYSFRDTIQITFPISISSFTYNCPLTFAIIFSFAPFIIKKRHLLEAAILLIVIHFVFLFLFFGEKITIAFIELGVFRNDSIKVIIWEFVWGFFDNLVMRFEPFLVGAFLFFSFRSKNKESNIEVKKTYRPSGRRKDKF